MSDEADDVRVDPDTAREVLRAIVDVLPEGWALMPIGGTRLGEITDRPVATKDVDVVPVERDEGVLRVPPYDAVVDLAETLSDHVQGRKDHTSVKARIHTRVGPVPVELIRGRQPGKGGYFVSRNVLERCAEIAEERGRVLDLPVEGLAFLKAWAVHDKRKLVDAGKDARGYHTRRADAFRQDVRDLLAAIVDVGREPDMDVIDALFEVSGDARTEAIGAILADAGWPVRAR